MSCRSLRFQSARLTWRFRDMGFPQSGCFIIDIPEKKGIIWGVPYFERTPPCIHRSMAKDNLVLEYPSPIGLPKCLMIYLNPLTYLAVCNPLIWGYEKLYVPWPKA